MAKPKPKVKPMPTSIKFDPALRAALVEYAGAFTMTTIVQKAVHRFLREERPDLLDKHKVADMWP